ncbi:self-incompatibility protein S1-like [Dioscorea cayenensis subsp. rotundata]|uniref:S-protein homolog n=1 Tax=Dioscorea cayennensis subsp. rotundata TaxID=55577 RepID=A0AB40CME5_DIOCR|nr:self-incompatibility protein S1-like [Dioscorea cayenensis subsp. rotundata]
MDPRSKVLLLLFLGSSCLCCVASVSGAEQLSNETVILFGPKVVIWSEDTKSVLEAGGGGNGRTTVHIQNRLGGGKNLSLHCKSKDDDLQQQTLAEGQEFVWGFNPNVWGTTLFFCNLMNPTLNFVFDAYDYKRDEIRCSSQCIWLVAAEGMYAHDEAANLWTYMYPWSSS